MPFFTPACSARRARVERVLQVLGRGLLAVDVLAGGDGLADQPGAHRGGGGVEEDLVLGGGERGLQVGGHAGDVVGAGQRLQLLTVAADQDGVGHQPVAIGQAHPAILPDRGDGADQVLVHAHAAGDTVHDDADAAVCHLVVSPLFRWSRHRKGNHVVTLRRAEGLRQAARRIS
ncbi:hypothetical protein ACFFMP_16990 [Pseudoroseomonas cervicalis]|uniref:hypothetical protein n=1 Tax=Teichococcus cervicalis TaxID=204525 RepID=UPI0035EBA9AE